jgi:hypothetical protein
LGFAFRSAIGIEFIARSKAGIAQKAWLQSGILSFALGDTLWHRNGTEAVQVVGAQPMGWDAVEEEMHLGSVIYDRIYPSGNRLVRTGHWTTDQVSFLETLIDGALRGDYIQIASE